MSIASSILAVHFFLFLGLSISVTARILLSGGSKKMMELSATFSAEMMVPPNLTAVPSVNFEGDNLRLIFSHSFANLSICFFQFRQGLREQTEVVYVLEHLEVLI